MRFPTILALLFQRTWTTCLLDFVPSQHASSRSAFAIAHSEWETGPRSKLRFTFNRAGQPSSPHPVWVTYWSQCAAPSWVHRRAFMVRWDFNKCLLGLSSSQRAAANPVFTATLPGSILVVYAYFTLCSYTRMSLCVWIYLLYKSSWVYYSGLRH